MCFRSPFQGNGAYLSIKTALAFMAGIPSGMRVLNGLFPVVSLRSTTGYRMWCLRHRVTLSLKLARQCANQNSVLDFKSAPFPFQGKISLLQEVILWHPKLRHFDYGLFPCRPEQTENLKLLHHFWIPWGSLHGYYWAMPDLFPIIEAIPEMRGDVEQMGSKPKFWFKHDQSNDTFRGEEVVFLSMPMQNTD